MAATIGYFVGVMFAAAGIGYIWLGFLWLIRVRKHWPRASLWSAALLAALVGGVTALTSPDFISTVLATIAAVVFILWRGRVSPAASPTSPQPAP